jgi:hypothetical protein
MPGVRAATVPAVFAWMAGLAGTVAGSRME